MKLLMRESQTLKVFFSHFSIVRLSAALYKNRWDFYKDLKNLRVRKRTTVYVIIAESNRRSLILKVRIGSFEKRRR